MSKLDFIGIGVPKSGTTWIYECLGEHPEICMGRPKKAHFFEVNQEWEKFFNNHFGHCDRGTIKGEIAPTYFTDKKILERIKNEDNKIKIIVCLRNPIDRAYSAYLHGISVGGKDWPKFEDVISDAGNKLVDIGFYYKHLKKFFDNFHRDNILVMIHEDMRKDPKEFIKKIYEFLEVDPSFVPNIIFRRIAPTSFKFTKLGGFIYNKISRFLKKSSIGRKLKSISFFKSIFYMFASLYPSGKKPEMREENRESLYNLYKDDIEKLENLIGRSLKSWKIT